MLMDKVRKILDDNGLDGIVVHNSPNLVYLSGVRIRTFERPMFLISNGKEHALIVPKLDTERASKFKRLGGKIIVYEDGDDIGALLSEIVDNLGLVGGNIGFDSSITVKQYALLTRSLSSCRLIDISDYISSLRYRKDEEELKKMERAAGILDAVFKRVESNIEPGVTESVLSSLISSWGVDLGADEVFFSAVQAGENSSVPHHERSSRKIVRGDVIVIDVSLTYENYFSDITRVFALGGVSDKVAEAYTSIKRAVEESFAMAKPGIKASLLDYRARKILRERGLHEFFIHRLGHGLGVEVHEPPFLSSSSVDVLMEGNVFTIEPGVYFAKAFGVRLERDVVMREDGGVYLDKYDTDIIVV